MLPVTVLLAIEHPAVREATRSVLDACPGVRVIGTAGSLQGTVDAVRELAPDAVVLGSRFAGTGAASYVTLVKFAATDLRVVVLSMNDSPDFRALLLERGADAVLRTDLAADELPRLFGTPCGLRG